MRRVILVHDEPTIAPLVAEALTAEGYTVERVCLCQTAKGLAQIKREAELPLIIRTASERSGGYALRA